MPPPPLPTLPTLPHDILRLITAHLPTASSVACLSLTCRSLHAFATLEGWRIFVRTRFPAFPAASGGTPADWRAWAKVQTGVARNWRRRGFVARVLEPQVSGGGGGGGSGGGGRWRRRGGAGMGAGAGKWAPRGRQTLGYVPVLGLAEDFSGGGEGEDVLVVGAGPDIVVRKRGKRGVRWWGFEGRDDVAGRDDITAVRLLGGGGETAVVGRANGTLEVVGLDTEREAGGVGRARVLRRYETGGTQVKDVGVFTNGGEGVVSAVLGASSVALYPLLGAETAAAAESVDAISRITLAGGEIPWKTSFLSPELMALGTTGTQPISVFALGREGFRAEPMRTFSAAECAGVGSLGVHALSPLGFGSGPNVFLAGWYDGVSRLHDLRSPAHFVAEYKDPLDAQNSIYSLLPLAHNRFLTGGGRHCILKVFDLRSAGGGSWATYLQLPGRYPTHGSSSSRDSPVYSLALAAGGRNVYAGTQGQVWELDFAGRRHQGRDGGPRLSMYGFEGGKAGILYRQGPETEMGRAGMEGGRLDGRWGPGYTSV